MDNSATIGAFEAINDHDDFSVIPARSPARVVCQGSANEVHYEWRHRGKVVEIAMHIEFPSMSE